MSDHEQSDKGPRTGPDGAFLIHGPASEQEREAHDRDALESKFKENQVKTNNRLVLLNLFLVLGTLATASIGVWQAVVSRRAVEIANQALTRSDQNSLEASRQFQVQLGHFDAGLGRTGLLAQHAGEQADAANKTSRAARDSADIAARTLDVSNRPWIAAIIIQKSALVFGPSGASVSVGFQMKNVGRTPAIQPLYHASIVSLPHKTFEMVEIKRAEKRECDSFSKHFFAGSPTLVPTIFPGEDAPQVPDWPATINVREIGAAASSDRITMDGKVELVLVACVAYQDSYRAKLRHSAYGFALGIPSGGGYMAFIAPQGTYPEVYALCIKTALPTDERVSVATGQETNTCAEYIPA